jgi:hypothetical protein
MMSKNISLYIYFMLCVKISGHTHGHHSSHTTSHNNNNNEESYNVKPKYRIVGNNNIIKNPTFKKFVDSIIEKQEYNKIIIKYYVSNIILDSKDYYGECLVYNSQINENITTINIENITTINIENIINYDEPITYNDYINNDLFNNNSDYCIKYQSDFSKNKSLFMLLFVFMLIICFFTECFGCCSYSVGRDNLY